MKNADVVVVGGGPAGLAAAEAAATGNLKVIVLEQKAEIGSPIHTSGGSFIESLKELGIPDHFYHPVSIGRFIFPSREVRHEYDPPVACVIDVRGTYQYLAMQAAKAGAEIRLNSTVLEPIIENDYVVGVKARNLRGQEVTIRAKVVVDAGGYKANLSKKAGLHNGATRFGVGAEYDLYAPNYDDREAVLIVGSKIAPAGYAWTFPWGNGRVRVGIGIIHPDSRADPRVYLEKFVEEHARFEINLTQAQPLEYHYGLIPSDGFYDSFVGNGIVAVGDAAGHPSALLGEGIRFSIVAGRMAGRAIKQAIEKDDFSKTSLLPYERQWKNEYGVNFSIAHIVNQRIATWSDEKWDIGGELLAQFTADQVAQLFQSNFLNPWLLTSLLRNSKVRSIGATTIRKKLTAALAGKTLVK